jgi:hypothetical protein
MLQLLATGGAALYYELPAAMPFLLHSPSHATRSLRPRHRERRTPQGCARPHDAECECYGAGSATKEAGLGFTRACQTRPVASCLLATRRAAIHLCNASLVSI